MDNLARKLEDEPVLQHVGTVERVDGAVLEVRTATGTLDAGRAVSCLLEPLAGDRVLVCGSRREGWYVLAILTREEGSRSTVSVDGDLELRLPGGRFAVAAQHGVEIVSGKDVAIVAGTLDVHAAVGEVALGRLTVAGALVEADIETVKLHAERFDSVVERVTQKVKRSFRSVEESDQVRAERIDYAAQKTMSLHSGNAIITAEELVKVDAEQIHLG